MENFGFRIRGLSLHGYRKDYTVRFSGTDSQTLPLSLIAGEISTGKTTVLEFIDYCLGASRFPEHIEIVESVRSARLEILAFEPVHLSPDSATATGEAVVSSDAARWGYESVSYVVERSIEGINKPAHLYRGTLDNFGGLPRVLSPDSSSEDSISKFLLQLCDLDGIRLRQAPSKADSPTHALSFRDLGALWYLTNTRLDNKNLALEHRPPIAIKLRQVVDLVFNVYDENGAELAQQVNELRSELTRERAGLAALQNFLREQAVTSLIDLEAHDSDITQRIRSAQRDVAALDQQLSERTSFAASLRDEYLRKAQEAREAGTHLRDRETLLRRLSPLRAQYAEDIKKLALLAEAKRIFDPLSVKICPACATDLKRDVTLINGRCSLCNSPLIAQNDVTDDSGPQTSGVAWSAHGHEDLAPEIDVSRELSSTKRQLKELKDYIGSVESEVSAARSQVELADSEALRLQKRLDDMTQETVTPYISQRDQLLAVVSSLQNEQSRLEQQRKMLLSVERRAEGVERLAGRLSETERRLRELELDRRNRDQVLTTLSERFSTILHDFGFPKLANAYIDKSLIPHVRGVRYDRVGSSGAMTLIALAWELAFFELAFETGGRHPGFLMIDSPQKNLAPENSKNVEPDFRESNFGIIVNRVYSHITNWLSDNGSGAQIIIVDNVPPSTVENRIVVRYSGNEEAFPYGLIDDAIAG